ncbi:MAG: helix-turn-helix domain-containing protein [Gammaproteobacteria bacterium]|nr:helix-turn-helix domain-containing protein [Gammaproteobacteria bacterium]
MGDETINVKQAADLLHVHEETARDLARQGQIPAAKFGRSWVFIKQDLLDAIRSRYTIQDDRCRVFEIGDIRWLENETRSGISTSNSMEDEYANLLKRQ